MVALLHDGGIKVERIARLVGELNPRLFARVVALLAPPELVANSCLVVMGSEGRGEQIIKTDQDNALLLRDGFGAGRPRGDRRALQRRAGRARLSALPRRHHADQPALARQRGALQRDAARLDLRRRPRGPDASGDLLRRRGRGRRCRAAGRGRAPSSTASSPAATRSSRASPRAADQFDEPHELVAPADGARATSRRST